MKKLILSVTVVAAVGLPAKPSSARFDQQGASPSAFAGPKPINWASSVGGLPSSQVDLLGRFLDKL